MVVVVAAIVVRSSEHDKVEYHQGVDEHERYCDPGSACPAWVGEGGKEEQASILLISVRTDDTRLISRAFTLVSSR